MGWKRSFLFTTHLLILIQNEYSEQWALACGEILRILTHYNRPIYKREQQNNETDRSSSDSHATSSESAEGKSTSMPLVQQERKPFRPLSPWITDILLAAPLGIRSDYFRWWVPYFILDWLFFFWLKSNQHNKKSNTVWFLYI
jgi:uncharacterized Zn-finger protein